MKIALDFDDTYTRDTIFWDGVIDSALARGHDIRIVTFRKSAMQDPALNYLALKIPIIYTEFNQKRPYCESVGFLVDVWIDDSPEFIVNNTSLIIGAKND